MQNLPSTTPAVHSPALWLRPATPDMDTLRRNASALLEQSAFDKRAAEAVHPAYKPAITVGSEVIYHRPSYGSLTGTVLELCAETDRAFVRFSDEWGVRAFWMGREFLSIVLTPEAAKLEVG